MCGPRKTLANKLSMFTDEKRLPGCEWAEGVVGGNLRAGGAGGPAREGDFGTLLLSDKTVKLEKPVHIPSCRKGGVGE